MVKASNGVENRLAAARVQNLHYEAKASGHIQTAPCHTKNFLHDVNQNRIEGVEVQ